MTEKLHDNLVHPHSAMSTLPEAQDFFFLKHSVRILSPNQEALLLCVF